MTLFDRLLEIPLTIVLIIGGYQFYFWCQRQTFYEPRYLETPWDRKVVFDPRWVWVYSGLYYPMIVLAALAQPDWPTYARTVGGFLFLLAVQMFFFLRFPVAIPKHWRERVNVKDFDLPDRGITRWTGSVSIDSARAYWPRSMRFLDLVWSYDKLRNSMPSMHVSVATMVDLTISMHWPAAAYWGWLFPLLIGISAIRTKQHYLADVIPGAVTGAAAFALWWWVIA